ncbi:MAG: hypothetical protein JWO95_675 [Verrucomicrobiales bacterium]|nr:hypothetical protein [Verrucomicrobiales bacterium]
MPALHVPFMKNRTLLLMVVWISFTASLYATTYSLNLITNFPAGSFSWLGTASNQRGMAYNPSTGHILVVDKATPAIHILDPIAGTDLGTIDASSLATGGNSTFVMTLVRVADDGAVYAANLENTTGAPDLNIYRWPSESSAQSIVWHGHPGTAGDGQRYGDTMDVRGSGTNTMIIFGSRGTVVQLFRPTDDTLSVFTATTLTMDGPAGSAGYGITFGPGNTFYGAFGTTSGTTTDPLRLFSFDVATGAAKTIAVYPQPPMPTGLAPIKMSPLLNLLGGAAIKTGDAAYLYDVTSTGSVPILQDSKTLPTDTANGAFAGAIDFGYADAIYGTNRLFVMDCNNGVQVYAILTNTPAAPTFFGQPANVTTSTNSTVTFRAGAQGDVPMTFQWFVGGDTPVLNATNSILIISNAPFTAAGSYTVVASNTVGAATSSAAVLAFTNPPPAVVVHVYEPFNYNVGEALTGKSPGIGMIWNTNGSGDDTTVVSGNLSYTGFGNAIGNSITNGGSGAAERLSLGQQINRGPLYYSFLLRVDSLGAFNSSANFIAAFVNQAADVQDARLVVRLNVDGTGYQIGANKTSKSTAYVWAGTDHFPGETVLIVGRYTFNSAASSDDTFDLWINPTANTFGQASAPAPTLSAPLLDADITLIDTFVIRQSTSANTPNAMTWDEVRVDTTWAAVTPIASAVPASPTLGYSFTPPNIVFSWPTNAGAFALQSAASLPAANNWANVVQPVVVSGANNTVTVPATDAAAFFRLKY